MTKRLGILSCLALLIGACASQEAAPAEENAMPAESTQGAETPAAAPAPAADAKPAETAPATPAAEPAQSKPPEASGGMIVIHNVKDYDTWKPFFDGHEQARKDAGFLGHGLGRVVDNKRGVMVWLPTNDLEKAKAFSESKDLKAKMKEAGVAGLPRITLLTTVENEGTHDPAAKYGAIVQHKVKDYDAFKPVFDDGASLRTAASVVGHAVGQDPANAKQVTVWLQATDLEKLKAFLESKELKGKMKEAGVRGAPTITIVELGERKFYQ